MDIKCSQCTKEPVFMVPYDIQGVAEMQQHIATEHGLHVHADIAHLERGSNA